MKIEQTTLEDVTVFHLAGDFFGTPDQREMFEDELDRVITDGGRKVVLDISRARLISSTGIGMIVVVYNKMVKHGGMVAIARPSEAVKPLLDKFDWPVMCFSTMEEAIDFLNVAAMG